MTKRYYQSVKQFEEDIHLILSNALFFNEESSRIWKDARILSVSCWSPPSSLSLTLSIRITSTTS